MRPSLAGAYAAKLNAAKAFGAPFDLEPAHSIFVGIYVGIHSVIGVTFLAAGMF